MKSLFHNPERMARKLARGKRSFIWRVGVLGWGVPMFLITAGWDFWHMYREHRLDMASIVFMVPLGLAIWLPLGYWFGAHMWDRYSQDTKQ